MCIALKNGKKVISATLIDVETGNRVELKRENGSYCHFYEKLFFEKYEINLRIDWSSTKTEPEPILDANIFEINNGERVRQLPKNKKSWHQTRKIFNPDQSTHTYFFKFREFELELTTEYTFSRGVSLDAIIVKKEET